MTYLYYVLIAGPAGSGKSSLTASLASWMAENELDAVKVNFDPAAEVLPYTPDVDVRRYVNARELMVERGLGPNGALVASVDFLINYVSDIREEIEESRANYALIDLPGQLEIVAFRRLGPILLKELVRGAKSVMVFLLDARLASDPSSAFSSALLALSTLYRVGLPMTVAINKVDLVADIPAADAETFSERIYLLRMLSEEYSCVEAGSLTMFMDAEVSVSLCRVFKEVLGNEVIPVSAREFYGIGEVYGAIQRVLAGGEDYLTEEPSGYL